MGKYNEKYFNSNQMHNNKIEDLVTKDEEILWQGKPKRSAFIWSNILTLLPFALIWLLFDAGFITTMVVIGAFDGPNVFLIIFTVIFFILHLTPFWIWLGNAVTASARQKNTEYVFKKKRIIIRTGLIIDIKNIYYMDIENVNIRVGIIDRILKVGDIYITGKDQTAVLNDLENPYQVFNVLQEIVNNIKTDMHYPNELRPQQNKGYKTKYTVDKIDKDDKIDKK